MNIQRIVENIKNIDYSAIDIDQFLDERDMQEFATEWCNIYNQINKDKIPKEIILQSDKYRKEIFLKIDEMTDGSEMSEYISDDIELLIFADYYNISSDWFVKFVDRYENGELPTGIL